MNDKERVAWQQQDNRNVRAKPTASVGRAGLIERMGWTHFLIAMALSLIVWMGVLILIFVVFPAIGS